MGPVLIVMMWFTAIFMVVLIVKPIEPVRP